MDEFIIIIGLVAAFLTTFAYLPQFIKIIKTKKTNDLSLQMILMLELGLFCWFIYGMLISSIPIISANTLSLVLMSIILFLKIKHK